MMRACAVLLTSLLATGAGAQLTDPRLPISLDAQSTDYDGKNAMLLFRGLKLTQGNIGVVADLGRANKLDFEKAVWQFSGNVRIDMEGGFIECHAADIEFHDHVLTLATIQGDPAVFELRRPENGEPTQARAERLRYNLSDGIVEFSGNAEITQGGNRIASNTLVYDIAERRINARSSGKDDDRVEITYTPPTGLHAADDPAEASDPEGE